MKSRLVLLVDRAGNGRDLTNLAILDLALGRLILAHTPRFVAILNAGERRIKKGRGIKHRDFWKAVDKQR